MTTTITPRTQALAASELLFRAVEIKWFGVAPARVHHWLPTITEAYQAYLEKDDLRLVSLPDGATGPDGNISDPAIRILEAFDDYLGRNIVWAALDMAKDGTIIEEWVA